MGEEWRPSASRGYARLQVGLAVLWLLLGLLWWFVSDNAWMPALYLGLALLQGPATAHALWHQRVRVGPDGLDVPWRWRRMTVPWSDGAGVRGNAGAWSEHLLLERTDGSVVGLPPGLPGRTVAGWRERYSPEPAQDPEPGP